jgi:hypothetical protein
MTRGEATDLGTGLYRGMGFVTASVGWVELGRAAGVFIGAGTTCRGARSGVEDVAGTGVVNRGVAMASTDFEGETVDEGKGLFGGIAGRGRGEADKADGGVAATVVVGAVIGLALAGAGIALAGALEVLEGAGFTNVFEGASGGGVTSAFIFARARSAAERSVSTAQLFSTMA